MLYRIITLAAFILPLSGCTLTTGLISAQTAAPRIFPGHALNEIAPGTAVELHLKDGSVVAGTLHGPASVTPVEYGRMLASSALDGLLEIDAPVVIHTTAGTTINASFVAFERRAIEVHVVNRRRLISLDRVASIELPTGHLLNGPWLQDLDANGDLPLPFAPPIRTVDGLQTIQVDQIERIDRLRRNHLLWQGITIGAAVDLVWLYAVHRWTRGGFLRGNGSLFGS